MEIRLRHITATLIVKLLFSQYDISYVRYFEDDMNFMSNLSMLSTDRRGIPHIAVSYNEKDIPVKIERFSKNGVLFKREMLIYNNRGKLIERGEYDQDGNYVKLVIIGEDEPWSIEFRRWHFPVSEPLSFKDQRTNIKMDDGENVSRIIFETIDGQKYGQIDLDYDYLGNLAEERWRDLPSGRVNRRFKYQFDVIASVVQIWEYGYDGNLVSHMALSQAPSDKLYRTPPPRTGNVLNEADIITKEIIEKRVIVPLGGEVIPKTYWDQLVLKNGDLLMIDFVSISDNGIKFRLKGEGEFLTIPIDRVKSLTSRLGDVIYPKLSRRGL